MLFMIIINNIRVRKLKINLGWNHYVLNFILHCNIKYRHLTPFPLRLELLGSSGFLLHDHKRCIWSWTGYLHVGQIKKDKYLMKVIYFLLGNIIFILLFSWSMPLNTVPVNFMWGMKKLYWIYVYQSSKTSNVGLCDDLSLLIEGSRHTTRNQG